MAYDKNKIFEQSKEIIINDPDIIFIEDVIAELPCSKPCFYELFPVNSNEFNNIKELIDKNKIAIKKTLRRKWSLTDNATLQLSLYKLAATKEEREFLSMNEPKDQITDQTIKINIPVIKWVDGESDKTE